MLSTFPLPEAHFNNYSLTSDYDKHIAPLGRANKPLSVFLRIIVLDILNIKEFDFVVSLDLMVIRYWTETRLEVKSELRPEVTYPLSPVNAEKFWVPEFYVHGMLRFSTKQGNMDLVYLVLMADQMVAHYARANMDVKCKFDFQLFPMDVQTCEIDFTSPLVKDAEQTLDWYQLGYKAKFLREKPGEDMILPNFRANFVVCPNNFPSRHVAGNVSTVRLWLVLKRQPFNYLLETYVPTGLFVIVSWGSFLVKPEVVPGRMVLLVTNMLSLVTLFEAARTSSPPGLGVKSMDVWVLSCIAFVILALLEYCVILFTIRQERTKVDNLSLFVRSSQGGLHSGEDKGPIRSTYLKSLWSMVRRYVVRVKHKFLPRRDPSWCFLDRISLVVFPFVFALFNAIYWSSVHGTTVVILADWGLQGEISSTLQWNQEVPGAIRVPHYSRIRRSQVLYQVHTTIEPGGPSHVITTQSRDEL